MVSRGLLNRRPHPSACGPSCVLWLPPSSGRSRLGSVVAAASMAPAVGRAGSSVCSRAAAAAAAMTGWARQGWTATSGGAGVPSKQVRVGALMGGLHLHGACSEAHLAAKRARRRLHSQVRMRARRAPSDNTAQRQPRHACQVPNLMRGPMRMGMLQWVRSSACMHAGACAAPAHPPLHSAGMMHAACMLLRCKCIVAMWVGGCARPCARGSRMAAPC